MIDNSRYGFERQFFTICMCAPFMIAIVMGRVIYAEPHKNLVTCSDWVDCVWLMPIYPSPLKDDGYDISDYYNIHSQYGTLDDFNTS